MWSKNILDRGDSECRGFGAGLYGCGYIIVVGLVRLGSRGRRWGGGVSGGFFIKVLLVVIGILVFIFEWGDSWRFLIEE